MTEDQPIVISKELKAKLKQSVANLTDQQLVALSLKFGLNTSGISLSTREIKEALQISNKRLIEVTERGLSKITNRSTLNELRTLTRTRPKTDE